MEDPVQSAGDPDRAKTREGYLALQPCSVSLCFLVAVSEQPPQTTHSHDLDVRPKATEVAAADGNLQKQGQQ